VSEAKTNQQPPADGRHVNKPHGDYLSLFQAFIPIPQNHELSTWIMFKVTKFECSWLCDNTGLRQWSLKYMLMLCALDPDSVLGTFVQLVLIVSEEVKCRFYACYTVF
jgi:hypothetical protein